ncbi:prepilin-type N-terminal cleavage/methylation domain-containing protein [Nitrospirillum sp. BR 11752]|uniref:type II secretion system protein n=1 Tax=Nitrospirillum sp. BR 11752 TaxID=3104293 RepID=UPI002EB4B9C8|nr:prepilin-type N-terminal cleavage/methylation domain-containing protein [Nitrospirillum sp. BR 11752]
MNGSRGFTLLEMLVALTVFGLVTAMLAHNTWSGVWAARQAWTEASALSLAQSMAVVGSAMPYTQADLMATSDPVISGLPFRLKGRRTYGTSPTYAAEVSSPTGQTLATSVARVPPERAP